MKQIQLSPNISEHDVSYRVEQANKFLSKGIQVKVVLSFKGRERIHQEIGMKTMIRFLSRCNGTYNIKVVEGRRLMLTAVLNPKK